MKRVRFFALGRPTQDRFVAACYGAAPAPLLAKRVGNPLPWGFAAASVVGAVAFVVLLRVGYGQLDSSLALSSGRTIAGISAALMVCLGSAVLAVARFLEARSLPFPRGWYLFPSGLVDARTPEFFVHPLEAVARVEAVGNDGVRVVFTTGARPVFQLAASVSFQDAQSALKTARETWGEAVQDDATRAALDPLAPPRFENPLGPQAVLLPWTPRWRVPALASALVLGATIGWGSGIARNRGSERALYAAARDANSPEAYRKYLARGGKRADVPALLLPTAELHRVVEQGSLSALEAFARENDANAIRGAIDLAVREALLKALSTAQEAKTMTALAAFEKEHAAFVPLVGAELSAARHDLAQAFGEEFLRSHAAPTEGMEPFVKALMRHTAENGPDVFVRFQRVVPDSVERADNIVSRDKYFAKVMLPSQYFDDAHSRARETIIFGHLQERFERAFPKDVVNLTLGDPVLPGSEPPESAAQPTLYLLHSTNMGGGIPNQNPNGTFVGIGFLFKARFEVPKTTSSLQMKHSVWRLPDLLKLRKGKLSISDVYTTMADGAFSGFDEKLIAFLFREQTR